MTDCKKKPGKDRANLRDMNSDSEACIHPPVAAQEL
jgi:hypothetical protein